MKKVKIILVNQYYSLLKKWRNFKKRKQLEQQLLLLKKQAEQYGSRFNFGEDLMVFDDDTPNTDFDRHYIYHPAWAARIVKQINPVKHIDLSSTLHFSSVLSAFIPTEFYDYRPAELILENFKSGFADLVQLPFADASVESLSCMHTIEHIGLGRYGDPIDYDGDIKAMAEISRVIKPGGSFLFVVPMAKTAQIRFNGHRLYSKELVLDMIAKNGFSLRQFVLIPQDSEDGGLIENPTQELLDKQKYGCGCFWLMKNTSPK